MFLSGAQRLSCIRRKDTGSPIKPLEDDDDGKLGDDEQKKSFLRRQDG
jgi:hypothetical protein